MKPVLSVLACDVGAGSGRLLQVAYNGDNLALAEIIRFDNGAVRAGDSLYWDVLGIYRNLLAGLAKASACGIKPSSLGIDAWGNDFVLLDKQGYLLENPYSYRDSRTVGMPAYVSGLISPFDLYTRNGIQQVRMNTLYQLVSLTRHRPYIFDTAGLFLFIPDFLVYLLTGGAACEYTLATISQLYSYSREDWDFELMSLLGIPSRLFPAIVRPGAGRGAILPSVCSDLNISAIPLLTVCAHDTASAVAAVPAVEEPFIYISSGTWSIVGAETAAPLINRETFTCNFSNEGGAGGRNRLNKNVMGLWLLQELQRHFAALGRKYSFDQMCALADGTKPFGPVIDPDHPSFYEPSPMAETIRNYCHRTRQEVPDTDAGIIRCALESLALKYRYVIQAMEDITKRSYSSIHIVGGGSNNRLLNQLTANYCKRPVLAGPAEATALGNALTQLITLGELSGLAQARQLVWQSFPPAEYRPKPGTGWDEHYRYFLTATRPAGHQH